MGRNYFWYLRQMPKSYAHQITIEKTPNYFTHYMSPSLIKKYQFFLGKDLKFILIVRDPIRRTVSHAFHSLRHQPTKLDQNLTAEILDPNTQYANSSLYGRHFQRWLDFFRRDQFLILDGEKFAKENPASTLLEVEQFLGLEKIYSESDFGFTDDNAFYCYRPTKYCFPKNRGRLGYSQTVTPQGKRVLMEIFQHDLEKFWSLTGVNFQWNLGQNV